MASNGISFAFYGFVIILGQLLKIISVLMALVPFGYINSHIIQVTVTFSNVFNPNSWADFKFPQSGRPLFKPHPNGFCSPLSLLARTLTLQFMKHLSYHRWISEPISSSLGPPLWKPNSVDCCSITSCLLFVFDSSYRFLAPGNSFLLFGYILFCISR